MNRQNLNKNRASVTLRPFLALAGSSLLAISSASATTYTWTQIAAGDQDWTTEGNWLGGTASDIFVSGSGNELKFFADNTTIIPTTTAQTIISVPAALSMNTLTLSGRGPNNTAGFPITIGTSASTWTLGDGTTSTVNLDSSTGNGSFGTRDIRYTVAANLQLTGGTGGITTFTGDSLSSTGAIFSGNITETSVGQGITKSGTSVVTLSGDLSYTGATTVNAGTLRISSASTLTSGYVINGGVLGDLTAAMTTATLADKNITVNGVGGLGVSGTNSTNGGITLNNGSELSLRVNGALTVNGSVTGAGKLLFGSLSSNNPGLNLYNSGNTFTGGVDFIYNANGTGALNLNSFADSASPGAGNIRFGVGTTIGTTQQEFNLASGYNTGGLTLNNRQFEITGTTAHGFKIRNNSSEQFTINSDLLVSATAETGARTLTLGGTGTGTSTFAGVIAKGTADTLNIIKIDSGRWILSGNNTYNGDTTISAGTLSIDAASNIGGSGTRNLIMSGGVLQIRGTALTSLSALDSTVTFSNTAKTFDIHNAANSFTVDQVISCTGTTSTLTKSGAGTLVLNQNNTYEGATTVRDGGTLVLDYSSATGTNNSKISNAALNLSGGSLVLRGGSHAQAVTSIVVALNTGNSISRDGLISITDPGATIANSGVLTLNGNLTIAEGGIVSTSTTNNASGIQNLGRVTVGSHFATRDGGGLLQAYGSYTHYTAGSGVGSSLSVVNQLTGGGTMTSDLSSYSLRIANSGSSDVLNLNSAVDLKVSNGGTLLYAGGSDNNYTINGTGTAYLGSNSGSQAFNVNVFTGTLTVNAILTSGGTSTLSKAGAGILVAGGASAYTGATYIQQGVLRLANDSGLGDVSTGTFVQAGAALELSQTTIGTPTNISVGAESLTLNGEGISNGGALRNHSGNNIYGGAITIGVSGARINSNADTSLSLTGGVVTALTQNVTFGGAGNTTVETTGISGGGSLIKDGTGTFTITSAVTYTGATDINEGTMLIHGSTSSSSTVTVASGATLGGDGTVGGSTTFNNGSKFGWNLSVTDPSSTGSATVADTFAVTGNLVDGGDAGGSVFKILLSGTQTFADNFWNASHTWNNVLTSGNSLDLGGLFSDFSYANASGPIDGPAGGAYFTLSGNTLSFTAIPEPTTTLCGLLLTAGLLRRRRKFEG